MKSFLAERRGLVAVLAGNLVVQILSLAVVIRTALIGAGAATAPHRARPGRLPPDSGRAHIVKSERQEGTMATFLNEAVLPVTLACPDDEIAPHVEALDDGRDPFDAFLWRTDELQDDDIASHLEEPAMLFAPGSVASPRAARRGPTRH